MLGQADHPRSQQDALPSTADADRHQREEIRQCEQHERSKSESQRLVRARHAITEGRMASTAIASAVPNRSHMTRDVAIGTPNTSGLGIGLARLTGPG